LLNAASALGAGATEENMSPEKKTGKNSKDKTDEVFIPTSCISASGK